MLIYEEKEIPEEYKQYFEPCELGLEPTHDEFIVNLCNIYDEVKRVLRKDGTCWVNLGDNYSGSGKGAGDTGPKKEVTRFGKRPKTQETLPDKSLSCIPFRFAIEMINRGWILRNTIIWQKPNCMPSSAKDRFTVDFDYVFFFVKSKTYWFEAQRESHKGGNWKPFNMRVRDVKQGKIKSHQYFATEEELMKANKLGTKTTAGAPGRTPHSFERKGHSGNYRKDGTPVFHPNGKNKRCVWPICPQPFPEAHFAVFPEELIEPMVKAGCPKEGIVLDPFMGSGTTALVACKNARNFIGFDLNPKYVEMAEKRIAPFKGQTRLEVDEA